MVTGVGDLVLGKEDYPTLTRLSYSLEKQSGNILIFNGSFFGSLLAFVGILWALSLANGIRCLTDCCCFELSYRSVNWPRVRRRSLPQYPVMIL